MLSLYLAAQPFKTNSSAAKELFANLPHLNAQLPLSGHRKWLALFQALYSWWQDELCDVFIELVKPVMARSSAEEGAEADKQAFRETLWTCLDIGLRCGC